MKDREWRTFSVPSLLLILATIGALLLFGMLEVLAPSIISRVLSTTYTAQTIGGFFSRFVIGALVIALIIILRMNELIATIILAAHLYIDWYLNLQVVSLLMALALLVFFFLARSPQYPWAAPRALWLWVVFLVLAILPAIVGEHVTKFDIFYYPNLIFGALVFFWLGTVVARNIASVRSFFIILSVFGVLLAVHTIILATTGTFLLRSSYFDEYLFLASNFVIAPDIGIYRLGGFFVDPNWNGTFFAFMLCIPLGLFFASSSFLEKILYLVETFMIVLALLFTFSGGAWIAIVLGVVVFVALVQKVSYRIQVCLFIVVASIVLFVGFPTQLSLLFQHLSDSSELSGRIAAWQTAVRVIQAFPLTGVGLGLQAYIERSAPYVVLAQAVPLAHPHNSYLELASMAGLPVLITFVALIVFAVWLALRNWALADVKTRCLLAGGIAAVIMLSVNSWSINGWTLPPLAATGWLVLGVISSPLLTKSLIATRRKDEMRQREAMNSNE
jgi:O-antigen ligase